MQSSIGFIRRNEAWSIAGDLFRNWKDLFSKYSLARPARIYSRVAMAATPVKVNFFQNAAWPNANIEMNGQFGSYFFLGHDIRLEMYEADGDLPTLADVKSLLANVYLSFPSREGR